MKLPILPVYYYHDHFTEMLSFVTETYGAVLTERHSVFIATLNSLSKDAQCLLIRLINRRGRVFRHAAFRYYEIGDPVRALAELIACGQVRPLGEDDYAALIVCLPKNALIKGGRNAGLTDIRTSWPKAKLLEYFLSHVPFKTAHEYCSGAEFIALGDTEPVEFLLYLYFGKTEDDLKNFTLRDLGILRTNKDANMSARFTNGAEARACFHYSRLLDHLELKSGDVYRKAIVSILGGPPCTTDYAAELHSRAAYKARSEKSEVTRLRFLRFCSCCTSCASVRQFRTRFAGTPPFRAICTPQWVRGSLPQPQKTNSVGTVLRGAGCPREFAWHRPPSAARHPKLFIGTLELHEVKLWQVPISEIPNSLCRQWTGCGT